MIEKFFVLSIFFICVGLALNLCSRGALFRQARRVGAQVRDLPAARRRRAYMANDFRATRERGRIRGRTTSTH
ncbi:MAG: hypothetical protein V4739_07445 [Pseudomonadota bacterium]